MSKPISISFGKAKSTAAGANISTQTPTPAPQTVSTKPKLLGHDSDDDAELKQPIHEAVTGFAADGAILGARAAEKELLVIKNAGNGDWRKRRRAGRNLLPDEVQAQDGNTAVVEKDEVSKASGLQYAKGAGIAMVEAQPSETTNGNGANRPEPAQERTEDEIALQALLRDGEGGPKSTAVILQRENSNLARPQPIDELGDYRADVASRPDSATLDEYEVMPVEEFGLALLRGMGTKRKANGQVASLGDGTSAVPKVVEPRPGYLGIGAKPAPGMEEIGAWGKAAMRKGMRSKTGDGLYTPVMLKDKRTGEMITEEELEARKLEAKKRSNGKEEDWRDRRDRNLERRARDMGGEPKRLMDKDDKYRDQMNAFSRNTAAQRGDRIASSRNDRSRSTDRRRRDDESREEKYRGRSHDGDRDRERERERERERKREREREMEREMEMEKEREKDRRRDKYRDDDRHRSSSSRNSRRGDREMKLYADDDGRRGRWRS